MMEYLRKGAAMAATKAKRSTTKEGRRFIKNVRAGIDHLELTQEAAGEKVGYTRKQMGQLLSPASNPTIATMVRMSHMISIPVHVLLDPKAKEPDFVVMPLPDYWSELPAEGELFLRNVRHRIKRLGMNGEEAGRKVGYAKGHMSQLLHRTLNPTIFTMARMAKMTDKPVHELLNPTFDPWGPIDG
jgi:DNA-binding phage protein